MDSCVCCKANYAWRIKLRTAEPDEDDGSDNACGHVVCINCVLIHLKNWITEDKPRIKCPSEGCLKRIHENDVRALLDLDNNDLDFFMQKGDRQSLLHKHDAIIVSYALGEENTMMCPRCKNIYAKKVGCNYVRCPNLSCNTWFCWECGRKDVSWAHFTIAAKCAPGWDDVVKGLYFISFLLFAGGCTLFYISIPIFFGLFLYSPLVITFGSPVLIMNSIKRQWIKRCVSHDARERVRRKGHHILYYTLKVLSYILLLPIGSIIGALSLIISLFLFILFNILLFIKVIPIVGQITIFLEFLQCITGCFGYGDWLQWYKNSKGQKEAERVANRNFRREASERLANPNVGR